MVSHLHTKNVLVEGPSKINIQKLPIKQCLCNLQSFPKDKREELYTDATKQYNSSSELKMVKENYHATHEFEVGKMFSLVDRIGVWLEGHIISHSGEKQSSLIEYDP